MTKYKVCKDKPDGYGGNIPDVKIIKRAELKTYKKNNWYVVDKYTPIITPLSKWWNKFTINQKIGVIGIILPLFFGGVKWTLENYLNHEYHSLKNDYKSLNAEYNLLNIEWIDSIRELNKKNEKKLKKLKRKISSDKK